MDVSNYIGTFGKISFVAFIAIFAFLVYEVWLLKKDRQKRSQPKVPQFNQAQGKPVTELPSIPLDQNTGSTHKLTRPKLIILIIAGMGLIFAGSVAFFSIIASMNENAAKQHAIVIEEVKSTGIKIYTPDWKEIKGKDIAKLKPGDKIIIGIETVAGADITEARIRVNESQWRDEHITQQLNKSYNVYYKEYIIPDGYNELDIDAQLHSKSLGWLSS